MAPDPDPGEEVALAVAAELVGPDFDNGAFIYIPRSNVACRDEVPKPLSGIRVDFIVITALHRMRYSVALPMTSFITSGI